MARFSDQLRQFAPDMVETVRRLPVPALFILAATILGLALINEVIVADPDDFWARLMAGLIIGAAAATGTTLFLEQRTLSAPMRAVAIWATAIVSFALLQIDNTALIFPYPLPVVALLWLALSPSLRRGPEGEGLFWWTNALAIPTAIIALAIGAIITLGLFAIDWSLSRLFGANIYWIFEQWLIPAVWLLLIPLYWLSTVPPIDGFRPAALNRAQDIPSWPIAAIGHFVLIPFTLVYAAILHAYALQIALAGALPDGIIGVMVIGYQLAGLMTWLLVYPAFMRDKALVRLFRRIWFWVSIIPLALLALAIWERFAAYGLTPRRVLLIAFALWAGVLCLIFLWKRGRADIRLIPGLAAILLALLSLGPISPEGLSRWQQTDRLATLLTGAATDTGFVWQPQNERAARAAFDYLVSDARSSAPVADLVDRLGLDVDADRANSNALRTALGLSGPRLLERDTITYTQLSSTTPAEAIDLRSTPYYLGWGNIFERQTNPPLSGFSVFLDGSALTITAPSGEVATADLLDWMDRQDDSEILDAKLSVALGEGVLTVLIQELSAMTRSEGDTPTTRVQRLQIVLFSSHPASSATPEVGELPQP